MENQLDEMEISVGKNQDKAPEVLTKTRQRYGERAAEKQRKGSLLAKARSEKKPRGKQFN